MKKIILASSSPRRREILRKAGIDFEIILPEYEENISNKSFSYEKAEETALNKGLSAAAKAGKNAVIISADTVVVYDNIILCKPKDFDDAVRMLNLLSGRTHKVVTAVCLIDNETGVKKVRSETSEVTFNKLTPEMIKDYILKFKPYDKAGSYGIQELNNDFIKEIKGSYENIIGLPVELVKNLLDCFFTAV